MAKWLSIPRAPDSAKDRILLQLPPGDAGEWTPWTAFTAADLGMHWKQANGETEGQNGVLSAPIAEYCKDPVGVVHFRGTLATRWNVNPQSPGLDATMVFTMPAGFRPLANAVYTYDYGLKFPVLQLQPSVENAAGALLVPYFEAWGFLTYFGDPAGVFTTADTSWPVFAVPDLYTNELQQGWEDTTQTAQAALLYLDAISYRAEG